MSTFRKKKIVTSASTPTVPVYVERTPLTSTKQRNPRLHAPNAIFLNHGGVKRMLWTLIRESNLYEAYWFQAVHDLDKQEWLIIYEPMAYEKLFHKVVIRGPRTEFTYQQTSLLIFGGKDAQNVRNLFFY